MKKLLHIECSPRKARSTSRRVATRFIEYFRLARPGCEVETADVWNMGLPEYDEFTANAKYRVIHGEEFTPEENERWQGIVELFNRFASADGYLFSIPMWNFSIPYKLKQYIDLITQPGLCFNVTSTGYQGLVTGRPAVVIFSSGGNYREPPAKLYDQQSVYIKQWLNFIGVTDIRIIRVPDMMADPETRRQSEEDAMEMAVMLASGSFPGD